MTTTYAEPGTLNRSQDGDVVGQESGFTVQTKARVPARSPGHRHSPGGRTRPMSLAHQPGGAPRSARTEDASRIGQPTAPAGHRQRQSARRSLGIIGRVEGVEDRGLQILEVVDVHARKATGSQNQPVVLTNDELIRRYRAGERVDQLAAEVAHVQSSGLRLGAAFRHRPRSDDCKGDAHPSPGQLASEVQGIGPDPAHSVGGHQQVWRGPSHAQTASSSARAAGRSAWMSLKRSNWVR